MSQSLSFTFCFSLTWVAAAALVYILSTPTPNRRATLASLLGVVSALSVLTFCMLWAIDILTDILTRLYH